MAQSYFDPSRHKWREVKGEPELSYKVRHDYTILGYDLTAGTLDMVVWWKGDGGHCPIHRHTSTTTVLVLDPSEFAGEWEALLRFGDGRESKVSFRRRTLGGDSTIDWRPLDEDPPPLLFLFRTSRQYEARTSPLTPEEERKLRALGYLTE